MIPTHPGTAAFLIGDTFDRMAELPDGSVDLVLTSPPFLALRSYLPADHPDKAKEIGSEPTPAEFLDTLLALTAEWGRVLAPHGSIAVELGDTYAGSGGAGGDYNADGLRDGQAKYGGSAGRRSRAADVAAGLAPPQKRPGTKGRDEIPGWPLDKSLCIIPELYAACLAYGRNVLRDPPSAVHMLRVAETIATGTPDLTANELVAMLRSWHDQAQEYASIEFEPWRVRNLVRWVRPNPPVGALGDKYRPATSVMVVACKARDRWFDLDAVRTGDGDNAGAPPLDWWEIPTQPYKGAHYATWPERLCVRPILSMCPRHVCRECGEPRRRTFEDSFDLDTSRPQAKRAMELVEQHGLTDAHMRAIRATGISDAGKAAVTQTGENTAEVQRLAAEAKDALGGYFREFTYGTKKAAGWTDCGHDNYRPGIVLDPFAGSGTTLAVATGHGRAAIGIDLDARNADLALERVGPMLLTVHDQPAKGTAA